MTEVLRPVYDNRNIFRAIIDGQAPCHKLYENEIAVAFLDFAPQGPGHTLLVPKTSAQNIFDLPCDEAGALMSAMQTVGRQLVTALAADGLEVQQLNGSAAGQTVFHLHFHLIPRFSGVPIIPHAQAVRVEDHALRTMAERIRGQR